MDFTIFCFLVAEKILIKVLACSLKLLTNFEKPFINPNICILGKFSWNYLILPIFVKFSLFLHQAIFSSPLLHTLLSCNIFSRKFMWKQIFSQLSKSHIKIMYNKMVPFFLLLLESFAKISFIFVRNFRENATMIFCEEVKMKIVVSTLMNG